MPAGQSTVGMFALPSRSHNVQAHDCGHCRSCPRVDICPASSPPTMCRPASSETTLMLYVFDWRCTVGCPRARAVPAEPLPIVRRPHRHDVDRRRRPHHAEAVVGRGGDHGHQRAVLSGLRSPPGRRRPKAGDDVGGVGGDVVAGVDDADRRAPGRRGIQVESAALAAAAWPVKTSSARAEEAWRADRAVRNRRRRRARPAAASRLESAVVSGPRAAGRRA